MRIAIDITRTDSPFSHDAWCATLDSYDGAPDSTHPIGFGATEELAVADLLKKLEDLEND
jgi:hypothetical protein